MNAGKPNNSSRKPAVYYFSTGPITDFFTVNNGIKAFFALQIIQPRLEVIALEDSHLQSAALAEALKLFPSMAHVHKQTAFTLFIENTTEALATPNFHAWFYILKFY